MERPPLRLGKNEAKRGDEEDEEKKKGMKMRRGRAAVRLIWGGEEGRVGNRQGKDEVCVCVCALVKPPTVMRQTNELAFLPCRSHVRVADRDRGELIYRQQK